MGGILNTCCTMAGDERDEIKISGLGSMTSKNRDGVLEYSLDETARTNDASAIGDSTKVSSGLNIPKKKILQFRMFKSLKGTQDITTNFVTGKQLGKGSFGEVRQVLNKATNVECAMKIVDKSHIGQH